ncbi:unnamed protein product [Lactuca saligna]|uniref:Uncharacterized protein n=1 Tax=Lactuca saligna TaxID=75948 RepID=A0AA35VGA2_LACSI|nr:unnamed protein product [Lactuca saligna]
MTTRNIPQLLLIFMGELLLQIIHGIGPMIEVRHFPTLHVLSHRFQGLIWIIFPLKDPFDSGLYSRKDGNIVGVVCMLRSASKVFLGIHFQTRQELNLILHWFIFTYYLCLKSFY